MTEKIIPINVICCSMCPYRAIARPAGIDTAYRGREDFHLCTHPGLKSFQKGFFKIIYVENPVAHSFPEWCPLQDEDENRASSGLMFDPEDME